LNREFFEALKETPSFENLPEMLRALLESIMSVPTEVRDIEVEESVSEVEMEAIVVAPEVVEVLAEVPKSPETLRLNPTPTKETLKVKKGK